MEKTHTQEDAATRPYAPSAPAADKPVPEADQRETSPTWFTWMETSVSLLQRSHRTGTSHTYAATLRSFRRFRRDRDLPLAEVTGLLMQEYEAHLARQGLRRNTTSMYMRVLRAAYNRAVEQGLTAERKPFRHVYTGIDKTVKRAVPLSVIKRLKQLELPPGSTLAWARDLFLFSFYTRGMPFVDMAYLRKSDLRDGVLTYCRRKTGARLSMAWEHCMQTLVSRHRCPSTPYLLPIIRQEDGTERRQYESAQRLANARLKQLARRIGLRGTLSMYMARHSWATAAREKEIPLSVISESMGHTSEATTRIYLAALPGETIDRANRLILKDL